MAINSMLLTLALSTLDLPSGPCCLDFTVARREATAWVMLSGANFEVGLSHERASLRGAQRPVVREGDALPPVRGEGRYRLFRLADRVVLEHDGAPVVAARLLPSLQPNLTLRLHGCAVAVADPQPLEPVYASDDFVRQRAEDGPWQPQSGHWRIGVYRDPLVAKFELPAQATWYETEGAGLSLLGETFWSDYCASVDLRTAAPAGVVFAAQDHQWGLFRRRGEVLELVVVTNGREQVVASVPHKREVGMWERLSVVTSGDQVRAGCNGTWLLTASVPQLASGRAGLWCDGPTQFDNFLATETRLRTIDHGGASTFAPFDSGEVTATLGTGAASVALGSAAKLELDGERWQLTTPAANQRGVAPGVHRELTLRRRGPAFDALLDGERLATVYNAAAGPTAALSSGAVQRVTIMSCGLSPTAELFRTDFGEVEVAGKEQGEKWRIIGDLLKPATRGWERRDARLAGTPEGDQTIKLWYRDAVPGDAGLRVDVDSLTPTARLSLLLGETTGYGLALQGGRAQLLRRTADGDQVLGEVRPTETITYARLWRDGEWVAAEIEGQRLAWRDPHPLGSGLVGLALRGGEAQVGGVLVTAENGFASTFGVIDTAWREDGPWLWNTGMACIAWSHWITGDGREKPAWLWRRQPLADDVSLDLHISEFTEGYDKGRLTHRHFAYHDLSVVLDGDGSQPDSGYRFLIGANGGHGVQLLRLGQVVATNNEFTMHLGDHSNTPRTIHVDAVRHGALLQLKFGDETMLKWTDPRPLSGGRSVGLGLSGCRANFSDLVALKYRAPA